MNQVSVRLDRALNIILTAATVVIAASVAYRYLVPAAQASADLPKAEYVSGWEQGLSAARPLSDTTAPVHVVVLADLECPACRAFHQTTKELMRERPRTVRVSFVSYPLGYHRFALPAARGAECAARLGQLPRWLDAVFSAQDSLGIKSWGAFAQDAGVQDTAALSL